jgi:hypothetical protein
LHSGDGHTDWPEALFARGTASAKEPAVKVLCPPFVPPKIRRGYLAAGVDANGSVSIVSGIDPTPELIPKQIGVVKGYSGQSISLTFTINSLGVEVDRGGFKSGLIRFRDLSNFSLAVAFPNGNARAALGAASQPGQTSGLASFGSIKVVMAAASAVP